MLAWRILLGAAFIGALVFVCWWDVYSVPQVSPGGWLLPLALLVCAGASEEMLRLVGLWGDWAQNWLVFLINMALVVAGAAGVFSPQLAAASPWERAALPAVVLVGGVMLSVVIEMQRYSGQGEAVSRIARATLSMTYVGLLLAFLVQLRLVGDNWRGMAALVSVIATVKAGDTGAYFCGRLFGRHRMTPVLSPGKTWEGAMGAFLFGPLAAWLSLRLLLPEQSAATDVNTATRWLVYGFVIAVGGMVGDLAESLLKREAGAKNSSAWMPGFGGVLDVLDSVLFAAPVAWLMWVLGVV